MRILGKVLILLLLTGNANAQVLNSDKLAQQKVSGENIVQAVESSQPAATSSDYQTLAKQAILIDFNSDSVLFEKESQTRMFPSSMTKVLTMYVVFDQLRKGNITMDTELPISEKSWKTGGSQMFLKAGDKVKVSDLIQGVIVQSGNDACVALAEGIAGSEEAFVADMNTIAKSIGMENTKFQNPNGLPVEDHYTTARDLTVIARRLITDFPEHFHYYSQREFTYAGITQHNRNKLLDVTDLNVDGMKTGYTELGGYGMIATGVNNGRRLVAVVNGLSSEKERLQVAADLLRYGYNNFKSVKLFNKFEAIEKIKIWGGSQDFVSVAPNSDIEFLASRTKANISNYKLEVAYKEPWFAPIKKGDYMANLVVKDAASSKVVAQYPLYANKDIAKAGVFKSIIQKIKYLLGKW